MLTKRATELNQVVSITTDGAPAMVGRERRAVARKKEDNPHLISYHCIIHQSVLCSTQSAKYAEKECHRAPGGQACIKAGPGNKGAHHRPVLPERGWEGYPPIYYLQGGISRGALQ
ncbi:hypothetical protein FQN60_005423 [Etheostoma spectabile]|uniref:DUF4371 domain-containing protein n=1 Tax=Etheostoma spectabile TaxID=54343 RepID=A0A5J5CEE2_9PERO|nr:hypothetical protein FQN60_005423 [Etheostoma spectabile]